MTGRRLGALFVLVATVWALRIALAADHVFVARDTLFTAVVTRHLQEVLLHGGDWTAAPLAWPLPFGTTLADWTLGQAVVGLPFRLLGADPLREGAAVVALALLTTAWAARRLAVAMTGEGPHTWIAAVAAGLGPLQVGHAHHVNLVFHGFALGGALLAAAGLAERRPTRVALGAALSITAGQFGLYVAIHAVVVLGAVLLGAALARLGDRWSWVAAALGAGVAGVPLLPIAALYARVAAERSLSFTASDLAPDSWDPATTLAPLSGAPLHGLLHPVAIVDPPNPGYAVLLLGIYGLFRPGGPRWAWRVVLALGVLGGALALGPVVIWDGRAILHGPYAWLMLLPGFDGLRAPSRWLWLVHAALGLFAARGLAGRPRLALAAAVVALLELPSPLVVSLASLRPPPVYAALEGLDPESALDDHVRSRCSCGGDVRLYAALFHGRPLVGGHYARSFAALDEVNHRIGAWPSPDAAEWLAAVGARIVLDHPPLPRPPPDADCERIEDHRICVLPEVPLGEGLSPLAP